VNNIPSKDKFHDVVKHSLQKEGWTITAHPLYLEVGGVDMYVDLAAEQVIAAERDGRQIAVEIKSFIGPSEIEDLKNALGQFILYRTVMLNTEPDRELYLAIRQVTFLELFEEPIGKLLIESEHIQLIVFNPLAEEIIRWIP